MGIERWDNDLHLTDEFKDLGELKRARAPLEYAAVAVVQEVRRHPKLRVTLENVARKLGKEIDLTKFLKIARVALNKHYLGLDKQVL